MFRLRRRSAAARAGIIAAVIGMFVLTSLPGAGAAVSSASTAAVPASSSLTAASASASAASASAAEGDTKCVAWGKDNLGLKCTGTYSGNTAYDPWTGKNLPSGDQPTVTISQARDLTDQDVQVSWSNFTPTIGNTAMEPNPSATAIYDVYAVSMFECDGTNPDWSDGYHNDCYVQAPVGAANTQATKGPLNGELENTLDTSVPVESAPTSTEGYPPWSPLAPASEVDSDPRVSAQWKADPGGAPSTWTGQADFHVEAPTPSAKSGFFDCGPSTPCSLVIDPNWGGTPNGSGSTQYTDTSGCGTHTVGNGVSTGDFVSDDPGSPPFGSSDTFATNVSPAGLSGESAACWVADRMVIPLSFAPTSTDCPNKTPQFYAQGSPMMQLQMEQWQAGWCTGPAPVTLDYTFNSENQARDDFLQGGQAGGARVDMALVTLPADASAQQQSARKFTYAPLANSGLDIAFAIDDATTGSQMSRLVLNQRLLAKLTTQSYTLQYGGCGTGAAPQPSEYCDPAVQGNPYSLFDDPEFLSLNQDCAPYGQPASYTCQNPAVDTKAAYDDFPANNNGRDDVNFGGFLPTVLQPYSDMTYDLSGYIAANPDAASFLAGNKDPSDMHVNNNYQAVSYPVQAFTMLDNGTSYPGGLPVCPVVNGVGQCEGDIGLWDSTMNASWNFQTDLDTIAQDLLAGQPTADQPTVSCSIAGGGVCTNVSELSPMSASSPEFIGSRALLSELDLGDIANYQFPAADLVNAAGQAVGPAQASVEAAVSDMKTNPDGVTQYYNFRDTDPKAYPLAMVDYAMVPTCGLPAAEASSIAGFLTKVATTGQVQGQQPGDLAQGYYPLNAKQKAQTLKAARAVKAQDCSSTPPDRTVGGKPGLNDTTTPGHKSSPTATPSGQSATTPASGAGQKPGKNAPSAPAGTPSSQAMGKAQTAAFGQKSPASTIAGILLLIAIIVGALLLVGGPAAWALTVTGKWPVVLGWTRPVQARLKAALAWLSGLGARRA